MNKAVTSADLVTPKVTTGSLPASRKVYCAPEAAPELRVPVREIVLEASSGEPNLPVYDTTGVYSDPDVTIDVGQFENALRGQRIAGQSGEAMEDGHGRFTVQLLIEDRLGQGVKRGLAKLHAARPYALDNRGQHGVGFLQVTDCKVVGRFAHRRWLLAGRASLAYRRTNSEFPFRHSIRVSLIREKPGSKRNRGSVS